MTSQDNSNRSNNAQIRGVIDKLKVEVNYIEHLFFNIVPFYVYTLACGSLLCRS